MTVIGPGVAGDEVDQEEEKKRKGQPVSKVEMDRQKILEEMKKRTQLLTDSSWIRQRSSSSSVAHKEPHYLGFALKRWAPPPNAPSVAPCFNIVLIPLYSSSPQV